MLLYFCSLQLLVFLSIQVQQESVMYVPVSLLQDAFFSYTSSVTVSCLLETPSALTSPAPSSHPLACSQLTFLPLASF